MTTSPSPLTIALKDHFGKGRHFADALQRAGHTIVAQTQPADALLTDYDAPAFHYLELIEQHKARGARVFLYPHGANAGPLASYDGLFEPSELVDANFVIGPGHAEVLRRLEYPNAVHAVGWGLTSLKPFVPRDGVRTVLFAPLHPSGDGSLVDAYLEQNASVYEQLLRADYRVVVRHVGALQDNGLWHADGVTYVHGAMDLSYVEVDAVDAVVAGAGTLPSIAIARGVPTVMYQQTPILSFGFRGDQPRPMRRPELHLDFCRYPFDAADAPVAELIEAAAAGGAELDLWRGRFVGRPFEPEAFVRLFERAVAGEPVPELDETRSLTVACFAEELRDRPELLAAYAAEFGPDDDATLVLWGCGRSGDALLADVQEALAGSGIDPETLPDVLLAPLRGGRETEAMLARRAQAVLSEWPRAGRIGDLPHFGAADVAALRESQLALR